MRVGNRTTKSSKDIWRVLRRDRRSIRGTVVDYSPTRIKLGRISNFTCPKHAAMAILKDVDGQFFGYAYIITKQSVRDVWDDERKEYQGAYSEVGYATARRIVGGKDPYQQDNIVTLAAGGTRKQDKRSSGRSLDQKAA